MHGMRVPKRVVFGTDLPRSPDPDQVLEEARRQRKFRNGPDFFYYLDIDQKHDIFFRLILYTIVIRAPDPTSLGACGLGGLGVKIMFCIYR